MTFIQSLNEKNASGFSTSLMISDNKILLNDNIGDSIVTFIPFKSQLVSIKSLNYPPLI